ncbi:MAG: glycosyltransferase family 4 protein [Oscillospiraceae bacterium]|jgi:glycosyltransferase involved in cell wall biosynthesis
MRIVQFTPSLSHGDAVSNDIIAMSQVLDSLGCKNIIVSINYADKVRQLVTPFSKYKFKDGDIALYHMSIGSSLTEFVIKTPFKKRLMVYHNITPAHFFKENENHYAYCTAGRQQLRQLSKIIDFSISDSEFNRLELEAFGFKSTVTLPIILNIEEYRSTLPDEAVLKKYSDGFVNILFVGRIAPNKKHEDVISAFHIYNKYINPKSRLFLIGSENGFESYAGALIDFISENKIKNVFFSGHISFGEIIAYYKIADAFLCMSEHEGFCVPVVEAMIFNVPVIAYSACALPYTMGEAGVLINEKDFALTAELIDRIASDKALKHEIISSQQKRLEAFEPKAVKKQFAELIRPFTEQEKQ